MSNSNPILQGLTSSDPSLSAAINPPQSTEPAVVPPLRRNDELSPVADAGTAPGTQLPQMDPIHIMSMAFMGNAAANQQRYEAEATGQTPPGAAPGTFANKLKGALEAAGSGLGDAAAAQGGDPHSGWLGAVGRVLNARTVRKTAEANTKFEHEERLKNDQMNLALTNVQIRQHAMAMQKQDKEVRDKSAERGELYASHLRDNFNVQDNISQDQLNQLKNDKGWVNNHTALLTGYDPVLDASGNPKQVDGQIVETPHYSVIEASPEQLSKQTITVTPQLAKMWEKAGVKDVSAGTIMPTSISMKLNADALRFGGTMDIFDHGKVLGLAPEVKEQLYTAAKDEQVQHAIATSPGNPIEGLMNGQNIMGQHIDAAQKALDAAQAKGDQDAVQKLQKDIADHQAIMGNLDKALNIGFTPQERAAYQKEKDADRKQTEIEAKDQLDRDERKRHNLEDESIKRLEASGGSESAVNDTAGMLTDAGLAPSQLPKRSKGVYIATINAANTQSWQRYGKPYSAAGADGEFKYAYNTQTQQTLKYLNSLTGGPGVPKGNLEELLSASNALPRTTGLPALDDKAAWIKLETGNPAIAAYHTVITEVADQTAKILQGGGNGGTSDAKMRQAQELFRIGFTVDQMKAVTGELGPLLENRRKGMIGNNRFLQKDYYGTNGMMVTMVTPDGKGHFEVPQFQADAVKAKGAKIATQDDYARLHIGMGADH